jgi:hypothetical protein
VRTLSRGNSLCNLCNAFAGRGNYSDMITASELDIQGSESRGDQNLPVPNRQFELYRVQ